MPETWKYLGFTRSPYDARPLKPCPEDVELLVERREEMTQLCTTLSAQGQGAAIISGPPGVGKTSFFNVTQYLLESAQTEIGPHLMCARTLCSVRNDDTTETIARRALSSIVRSVEQYCSVSTREVPNETAKLARWIGDVGNGGFQVGVNILGCGGSFGRSVSLPKYTDASFERLNDALECVVAEIVGVLGFEGAFIVLDNLENLEEDRALNLLMSLRDTLFSCTGIWWILIGQSGFGGLMQSMDPRVYERMAGAPIELNPIGITALHAAIEKRVRKFHRSGGPKAPLVEQVHGHLYNASLGEIRFVFKYSSDVCINIMSGIVRSISVATRSRNRHITEPEIYRALGRILVQDQIPADRAEAVLKLLIRDELQSLNLRAQELEVLKLIGERGKARAGNFADFGVKTKQDFSSNYLVKLHRQNLLVRSQAGKAVLYTLRGVAALAHEYGLLRRSLAA
jgi:hypothetical protein